MKNISEWSVEQVCEMLWLINGASFDFTFMFDVDQNSASIVRFVDNVRQEDLEINDFMGYLSSKVHPDDVTILEKALEKLQNNEAKIDVEIRIKEQSGRRYRWHSAHMHKLNSDEANTYVGSSTYVDSRKRKESELSIKARQDPLTGLLNKTVTRDTVISYFKHHGNTSGAMIVLDIDSFKYYNDCLGHLFGDEIIKEVAKNIKNVFSEDTFVGRVGGDEFLVLVKEMDDVNELVTKMCTLRDSLKDINLGQRTKLNISYSAGISLFPEMGKDFDSLFELADMALYYVKNHGKNSFAIFTDELYNERIYDTDVSETFDSEKEDKDAYSITNFAFHLLNEASDVKSAINLLLYKVQSEFQIEGTYIYELKDKPTTAECVFACSKDDNGESMLGKTVEYSLEAYKEQSNEIFKYGGYRVVDLLSKDSFAPGEYSGEEKKCKSMLHVQMRLLSKMIGVADFVSAHEVDFWDDKKISEIRTIVNLLAVCMYYSQRASKAENEVKHFSNFDPLTGLMKEDTFIKSAGLNISQKGGISKLSLLYFDISNFKYINEMYGYVTGDKILSQIGDYISNKLNGVLCAGRFYSDNILCLMEFHKDTPDNRIAEIVDDVNIAMSEYLSRFFNIGNIRLRTGIYILPAKYEPPEVAISNANLARKVCKETASSRCVLFDKSMFENKRKEIRFIQDVDDGIAGEEFFVTFQPKVSGNENRLVGAEALVRWRKADGRVYMPDEFIPALEKDGSITKLDFYVYEKVLSYIHDRIEAGKKIVPISMNVSRVHFTTLDFVERFKALVDKYSVPTQFIELELTESIYIDNFKAVNEAAESLRHLGIRISMDDFGSGYSSLNALNDLKIDLLKIDRIFMKNKDLEPGDKAIVKFIIEMAKSLSMKVMCEGVETREQRNFLSEAGCDLHQGFYYSKPVVMDDFTAFLENEELLFAKLG